MVTESGHRRVAIGESVEISVDPAVKYVKSGRLVAVGERYSFSAREKWKDGGRICDAAGWDDGWFRMFLRFNRVPNLPYFLLCGVVGRDDRNAFPIGVKPEWTVPDDPGGKSDGSLHLFANDIPFMYCNNHALDESEDRPLRLRVTRVG